MSLTVRPITLTDIPELQAHLDRHRAESGRGEGHFMPFEPEAADGPKGVDAESLGQPLSEPGWQRWFVALEDGGPRIVGHVDLKGDALRTGCHRCELGIGIERPWRRGGLGRRLMAAAIDFCRSAPSLSWLDLRVFADNAAGRALYRKLGFVEVGIVTDRFRIAGTSIDDVIMTLDVG